MIRPVDRSWQVFKIEDFSGGWTSIPQDPKEAQVQENLEVNKANGLTSFLGDVVYNSTNISSSGTYAVHSVYSGSAGSLPFVLIAATSQSKVWYSSSRSAPAAFTDITGGAALSGTYWSFTQYINASNEQTIILANATDGLYTWNGSGNITKPAAAPAAPMFVSAYQGHLIAAVSPATLHISDYNDPTVWPADQILAFSNELGPITGLASIPGKLIIFFKYGTGCILGEKVEEFNDSFIRLNTAVGTIYPLSVSPYGSEIGLNTINGPVIMSADGVVTEYIGEPLREFFSELEDSGLSQYSWKGHLTPFHYWLVRRDTTASESRAFVFDRRAKGWWEFNPPTSMFATSWALTDFITSSTLTSVLPRIMDLWPGYATSSSSALTVVNDSSNVYNHTMRPSTVVDGAYIEWNDVPLSAGDYKIQLLGFKGPNQGSIDIKVNGSTVSTWDQYNGSNQFNQKFLTSQFTVTAGVHTIRCVVNGKNASSANYRMNLQQLQLIKQSAGGDSATFSATHALPIDIPAFDFYPITGTWDEWVRDGDNQFGGYIKSNGVINAEVEYLFGCPAGTYDLTLAHQKGGNNGIYSFYIDGVLQGSTIDGYNASTLDNQTTTISVVVSSSGGHTLRVKMASKNASASAYEASISHIRLKATSLTGSGSPIPSQVNLWPWFYSAASTTPTIDLDFSTTYTARQRSGASINNYIEWSGINLDPGTYELHVLHFKGTGSGIVTISLGGTDIHTEDFYRSSNIYNQILTVGSVTVPNATSTTLRIRADSKNASSSAYAVNLNCVRLIKVA